MCDHTIQNQGWLEKQKVYKIIQEQLKSKSNVDMYKKVPVGLLCILAILLLSTFGTLWVSVVLSKHMVADNENSIMRSKQSRRMAELQTAALEYQLDPLSDEEFERRWRLVDANLTECHKHPNHLHCLLGKRGRTNKKDSSKIAYGCVKISEGDLDRMVKGCMGGTP